jgi:hypothetical protein
LAEDDAKYLRATATLVCLTHGDTSLLRFFSGLEDTKSGNVMLEGSLLLGEDLFMSEPRGYVA